MRIVILRHAEVDFEWSRLCSSKKFDSECSSYDSSPIKEIVLSKPQIRYEKTYISELSRSRDTAKMVFPNEDYIRSELINEVPLRSSFDTKKEMPLWVWNTTGRLQWFFNCKRQTEGRKQTTERARRFAQMICEDNVDCAIITHGFFMHTLIKEIKKAGFKTNNPSVVYKNGECIMAEK